ncbi:MAG: hypothetical protein AW11_02619 [Candidatus Accumulibacter regalis]|jgi:hypothetical protein|uniref:Uncharacterized protein n=2 Tax=Candidatus Accumulibacter TaxID=327159 RepID=A0A011QEL2_ACCRE|nr:DUF6587 family protein [Accumulibacter sp.]EXI87490.1 MAG: hypothetical protein AW11_02619 [Candidatus Accumulibacter regalis]MQM35898.1 hypothetical protein [Candidatus Accumulibacter phosphatis]HRE70801.1 hypothetical protein [Accumulibacter sp.]
MLEDMIVYAAVACAGLYSGWRLLPTAARFSLAEHAARLAQGMGLAKTDPDAVRRRAAARARSSCGGCSGCAGKTGPQPVLFINRKDS